MVRTARKKRKRSKSLVVRFLMHPVFVFTVVAALLFASHFC